MKKLIALSFILPFSINAMDVKTELVHSGAIVASGALAAYAFGQGAEWVSSAIAPEFTYYFNKTWDTPSQGGQAILHKWGFLATPWAGFLVAFAARVGSHRMAAQDLIKPVAITYGATAGVAVLAGLYKYLRSQKREKVGENVHIAARMTSYLAAPTGLLGYVLYKRIKS